MLARRFSTLDHLTGGRIGWNIVTAYLDSAAKDIGLPRQSEYDTRYDIAEEYMQIAYKLWEGSWEVGAGPRIGIGNTYSRSQNYLGPRTSVKVAHSAAIMIGWMGMLGCCGHCRAHSAIPRPAAGLDATGGPCRDRNPARHRLCHRGYPCRPPRQARP
jgi:alkanesulfonate monooxygenase SsuD/methylene tetrahydromethanopterin reductase-like flavin-dependent oxidoreductase (luciferase family)